VEREPEGLRPALDRAAGGRRGVSGLGDTVVLQHEEHGRAHHRREVEALVEQPLAERAVADEDHGDGIRSLTASGDRMADRDGGHAGLHPVRQEARTRQVLRSADAPADPGRAPHHFGEQSGHVVLESEVVPVAAMVREDHVVGPERPGHGDRRHLLPDARVHRPVQLPLGEQLEEARLELADEDGPGDIRLMVVPGERVDGHARSVGAGGTSPCSRHTSTR
jgi:hypothetical protein